MNEKLESKTEMIKLEDALGYYLAEDVYADRDFPPFDRVAMDGIAMRYVEWKAGLRSFEIKGIQAAGTPQMTLEQSKSCIEVMTGAALPKGTDTVIPYEWLRVQGGKAYIGEQDVQLLQNVHKQGKDLRQGEPLLNSRRKIGIGEMAILATVGYDKVKVFSMPKICIVSTGDELVDIDQVPLPHQIRKSNGRMLQTLLRSRNIESDVIHSLDDRLQLAQKFENILKAYDIMIVSGGVSMGKFDFIPEVLAHLGVQKVFHKIKQKPGKPLWFGRKENCLVFGFPGNPVSSLLCGVRYVLPWIERHLSDVEPIAKRAVLTEVIRFNPSMTRFLPVQIIEKEGKCLAQSIRDGGSGDMTVLINADGFLELDAEKSEFGVGDVFDYFGWH